jgi:RHS repeat-associated protein
MASHAVLSQPPAPPPQGSQPGISRASPAAILSVQNTQGVSPGIAQPLTCTPPQAPNEIVELARALKWNPDLIYEYVRNNIKTIPIYDSLKGSLGTLVDGAGTPVDQADLMVALLQQSSFCAQFEVGLIFLTAAQLDKWLGTQSNNPNLPGQANSIYSVLSANGFCTAIVSNVCQGFRVYTSDGTSGGQVVGADVPWVWVSVTINGSAFQFDPASKIFAGSDGYYAYSRGLGQALPGALNYNQPGQPTFLSVAEAHAGIGTAAITFSAQDRLPTRGAVAGYANSLISNISPSATTLDIIGGSTIQPLPRWTPPNSGPTRWGQTSLCYIIIQGTCYYNDQMIVPTSTSNLNQFRTTLTLTLGWNDANNNFTQLANPVTFNSSDIYGHRLSVQFDASGTLPTLLLDGVTQATATAITAPQLIIRTVIVHPHLICDSLPIPSGCAGGPGPNIDNVRVTPASNGVFVVGTGWGGTSRGMVEKHRKMLRQNQQIPGNTAGSEAVLGESLAMIGCTWLAEVTAEQQVTGEIAGITLTYPHAVGIIGIKAVGSSQGPYVDLPLNTAGTVQRVSRASLASIPVEPIESSAFFTLVTIGSILESGAIEQTQPGATAASTVKILDQWSQSGTIYTLNDPAISGDNCTYYANNVRGDLTQFQATDLARVDALMGYSAGVCASTPSTTQVIVPSSGAISIGQWTGTGYLQVLYNTGQTIVAGIGAIITGGLSGGEPASPVPPPQLLVNQASGAVNSVNVPVNPPSQQAVSNNSSQTANIAAAGGGAAASNPSGGDPVDLVTGSYIYSHEDMSIGSGPFPFSLPFVRSYDSGSGKAGLNTSLQGNGWMHNYDVTALVDSDGFEGMGENSPINGAAAIAALYVIQDILNQQNSSGLPIKSADRVIVAAIVERWLMDQLTNNIVSVARANSIERFTLLPTGTTYNPPLGSASRLTGSLNGPYTYQSGSVTLTFNPTSAVAAGKVAKWTNASGAGVNFTYNGNGQLQTVENPATQRQLNLHYAGTPPQLTSVDDNTRTISYSYNSQNDLAQFIDPLQQSTNFGYGARGQLARIFYPTHPFFYPFVTMSYDSLGRPNQQADANGNVTNLFFAGTRTEIDDPVGTARVSYFTPRGKTVATIDGLGSSTINGGAGNLTVSTYDGLDRLLTMTFPAGNGLAYTYDILSNPLTITQIPIPGSGLTQLVTSFTYIAPVLTLPNFEEVQTVTDPRGLVVTSNYDAGGNRISTVADSAGGHFNATTQFTYDALGRVLTATDPAGVVTANTYDSVGNLISTTADYGAGCGSGHLCQQTSLAYDAIGNAITLTDPKGNVTTSTYDANRRVTSTTLPAAPSVLVTTTAYDPDGRVVQVQQSSSGQVLRITSTTYTLTGKPATATDANGNVTTYTYDGDDRLSTVTDAVGRTTTYVYDALSRPAQALNLAVQAQPLVQYSYTPNSKLASLTDGHTPIGNVTTSAYDGLDRLSTMTWPDGSSEVLSYDADSNVLTRKTRKSDTITFTYDTLNRLGSKAASGEATVTYGYDLTGRLVSVGDNSASMTTPAAIAGPLSTIYTYDALNRMAGATWSPAPTLRPTATARVTFTHTYTAANQRSGQSVTDNTWLVYPHAPVSTIGYSANSLNQYSAVGGTTLTYDGNGNLTSDGTSTFAYDAENRLTNMNPPSPASPLTYSYDGLGRMKKNTIGTGGLVYVTDAENREVLVYDVSGGKVYWWYTFGRGVDEALNQMELPIETRTNFIPDIQGSMIATLGTRSGTLSKSGYLPYGENTNATLERIRYTGRRIDQGTMLGVGVQSSGLYYYRARTYSPTLGRFLQPDPIGYAGGANLYAYVDNDPLNLVDPLGLCDSPQCGGGGLPEPGLGHPFGTLEQNVAVVAAAVPLPRVLGFAYDFYQAYQALVNAPPPAPDFVVSPNGTAYPVPAGAQGPTPVINPAGNQTGVAFTGGASGGNGQVSTMRLMNPTPPSGNSPGYPNGYIVYQNNASPTPQLVDPITGQTTSRALGHFPVQ